MKKRIAQVHSRVPGMRIAMLAMIGIAAVTTSASAQGLLRRGQVVTLKIPFELMNCIRTEPYPICAVGISESGGSVVVSGRSDWETCCFPSLLEFKVGNIEYPPKKPKPNEPRITFVSLGSVTSETGLISVNFGEDILDVETALAKVVFAGPASGRAVVEYKAQAVTRVTSKLFTESLPSIGQNERTRVVAFVMQYGSGAPTRLLEKYKEKTYFVLNLGIDSIVYNTLQLNESARVARTINDKLLNVLKASLTPLADLGETVEGVKLEFKIRSQSALDRAADPNTDTLQIYAPRTSLKKFADADITSQQLIDDSVVLVNGNRVQVPLARQ
jgi:hypothetical protein